MELGILSNYKEVGKLHGNGDAFSSGVVKHIQFDSIKRLQQHISVVASKPKMCVCIGTFPRNGNVIPKDRAGLGDMTRTKDMVNSGHILVIDNDFGKDYDRKIFGKYWSTFKKAGYVTTKSGSTLAGTKKHGSHTYFVVDTGIHLLRESMEFLEAICIIEGYTKIEFYKTGKAVVKTPIDKALSEPSRLVYEDDTKPQLHEGENINISKLPHNHLDIMKKAEKIKAKLLSTVEKKSHSLHKKYVKQTTGIKLKTKAEIKDSLKTYEKYIVDETFKLHLDGECLGTVGDLILGKLKTTKFSDLYEPSYGGGSQKAIYYPETQEFFSQAHGGITYRVETSDGFNKLSIDAFLKEVPHLADSHDVDPQIEKLLNEVKPLARAKMMKDLASDAGYNISDLKKEVTRIEELKKSFDTLYPLWLRGEYKNTVGADARFKNLTEFKESSAYVNSGGKNVIVTKHLDDNGEVSTLMNHINVVNEIWTDRKTTIIKSDPITGTPEIKEVDTPTLFVEGAIDDSGEIKPCPRYTNLQFAPKKDLKIAYNLFNDFPIEPEKKVSIKRWKNHMTKCYGEKHYNYIMDWFAHMYQRPDEKCTHALVVLGEKGTGKNTFEEILGLNLLNNENYFRTSNTDQLFGKFNRHLATNLLIIGQEIVWGGSHKHDSALKEMITESTRPVEIKGVDIISMANFSRVYLTSNSDWVVPATGDERRYYVARTKSDVFTKKEWSEFREWLDDEDVKQSLMYEMVNRDISNFKHNVCPITKELTEQVYQTLYGVDRFIVNAIEDGFFGTDNELDNVYFKTNKPISLRKIFKKYNDIFPKDKANVTSFSKSLKKIGFDNKVRKDNTTYIIFPDKEECIKILNKNLGVFLDV